MIRAFPQVAGDTHVSWQLVHVSGVEAVCHEVLHISSPNALNGRPKEPASEEPIQWDALIQAQEPPLHLGHPGWLIAEVNKLIDNPIPTRHAQHIYVSYIGFNE